MTKTGHFIWILFIAIISFQLINTSQAFETHPDTPELLQQLSSLPIPKSTHGPRPPLDYLQLNKYFDYLEYSQKYRGSVAIYDGRSFYTRSVGQIDRENKQPANSQSRYRIGSISKVFTAVLTMRAIELGFFTLDTPVTTFFPYNIYKIRFSDKMTIRMLLNHRSGLFNYTNDPEIHDYEPRSLEDILEIVRRYEADQYPPDKAGFYCNTGYYLLGFILQQVFRQPSFHDVLKYEIIQPFGLNNTSYVPPPGQYEHNAPQPQLNESHSFILTYTRQWVSTPIYFDHTILGAAGAIVSTPTDLITFFHTVFIKQRYISKHSIRLMQKYQLIDNGQLNYGLGLYQVFSGPDLQGFGHDGLIDGFRSTAFLFPYNQHEDPINGDDFLMVVQLATAVSLPLNNVITTTILAGYRQPFSIPSYDELDPFPQWERYYVGDYEFVESSSPYPPAMYLYIDIYTNPDTQQQHLTGQANGQQMFPLQYIDTLHVYHYFDAGITIVFEPREDVTILTLSQFNLQFQYIKKNH